MSRYPMTDPITIPPFPQNEKEVPCGLLFPFYVTGAADSSTYGFFIFLFKTDLNVCRCL